MPADAPAADVAAHLAAYGDSLAADAEHRLACQAGCRLFGPPVCPVGQTHQRVMAIREDELVRARRSNSAR